MKIDLKKYYNEREKLMSSNAIKGPVITFSRVYGCEANRIARLLVNKVNERQFTMKRHPWRYISKEVLEESGKELGLHSTQVDHRIQSHDMDSFKTLFASLGQHYDVSDQKIIDKVYNIVETYANKGNVVIVGRGGSIVTKDMKNAVRIRLVAPLDWRASLISAKMHISHDEALIIVRRMDHNRAKWVENLAGGPVEDSIYDLTINVKNVTDQEIIEMILRLMEDRGFIGPALKYSKREKLIV